MNREVRLRVCSLFEKLVDSFVEEITFDWHVHGLERIFANVVCVCFVDGSEDYLLFFNRLSSSADDHQFNACVSLHALKSKGSGHDLVDALENLLAQNWIRWLRCTIRHDLTRNCMHRVECRRKTNKIVRRQTVLHGLREDLRVDERAIFVDNEKGLVLVGVHI